MKHLNHLLMGALLLGLATAMWAGDKFTPATHRLLDQQSRHAPAAAGHAGRSFTAFVQISDQSAIDSLRALGVEVTNPVDSLVTAQIPFAALSDVARLGSVVCIDADQPIAFDSDSALALINAVPILDGSAFPQGTYDGSGVIVAVIDDGFDVNHLAFTDNDGNSRVKQVFLVNTDSMGVAAMTTVSDPEQIKSLTTDDVKNTHGTHVADMAAGRHLGVHGGVAPGADLVLASLGRSGVTNAGLTTALRAVADYAAKQGKPCVVNMSVSNFGGPHNGRSYLSYYIDQILQNTNVIAVMSVGNRGGVPQHLHHQFANSSDGVSSMLAYTAGGDSLLQGVEAYSRNLDSVKVQVMLVDSAAQRVLYTSPVLAKTMTLESDADSALSRLASGKVSIYAGRNFLAKRRYMDVNVNLKVANPSYRVALRFTGKQDDHIDAWCTSTTQFLGGNMPGFTTGDDDCSMNDMATGSNTISVGSYVSRRKVRNLWGDTLVTAQNQGGELSTFSSRGFDVNGKEYPFITAPGQAIISADNVYYHILPDSSFTDYIAGADRRFVYSSLSGTSMAAPCVTGTIALWLQARPTLTLDSVRLLLSQTAMTDSYVDAFRAQGFTGWGAGKLNALDGLRKLVGDQPKTSINGLARGNARFSLAANPVDALATISTQWTGTATVALHSLDGQQLLSRQCQFGGAPVSLDVAHLPRGIYVVTVSGNFGSQSLKMIKR